MDTIRTWWNTPRQAPLITHFWYSAAAAFLFLCLVLMVNATAYRAEPRSMCQANWDCTRGVTAPQPVQEDPWPNR